MLSPDFAPDPAQPDQTQKSQVHDGDIAVSQDRDIDRDGQQAGQAIRRSEIGRCVVIAPCEPDDRLKGKEHQRRETGKKLRGPSQMRNMIQGGKHAEKQGGSLSSQEEMGVPIALDPEEAQIPSSSRAI